jgi:hypothetical protein
LVKARTPYGYLKALTQPFCRLQTQLSGGNRKPRDERKRRVSRLQKAFREGFIRRKQKCQILK